MTFNEYVIVTGTPQLELDFDGTAKTADYSSINGAVVVFSYGVAADDIDTDGIAISANKLSLNGGAIKDGAENGATLTHDAVAADSGHKVEGSDTTAPTVSSVAITSDPRDDDTYGLGDAIEVTVTFSEDVTVTGTPLLELDFDGTAKSASYRSASGANVVFSYTVALDESDADGIAIGADKLSLNEGTIKDAAENDTTLTHAAVAADSGHKVDGSDTHRAHHLVPVIHQRSRRRQNLRHRRHHPGHGDLQRECDRHRHAATGTEHVRVRSVGSAGQLQQ